MRRCACAARPCRGRTQTRMRTHRLPALIEDADDEHKGCRRGAAAIGSRLRRPLESPPLPALRR